MSPRLLEAGGTVAILLGAKHFPSEPQLAGGPVFGRSAGDMRGYLTDPQGLGLGSDHVLNLFDDPSPAATQLEKVRAFLAKGRSAAVSDVLFYYVGHGAFSEESNEFYLYLASTSRSNEASWLTARSLARILKFEAPHTRCIMLLDACFSGAATTSFMGTAPDVAATQVLVQMPRSGTILLCSSSQDSVSMAPPGAQHTMFTGALLRVLWSGAARFRGDLSLENVRDLVWDAIRGEYAAAAVRPVLNEPRQAHGDLRHLPAFPNPSAEGPRAECSALAPSRTDHVKRSRWRNLLARMRVRRRYVAIAAVAFALLSAVSFWVVATTPRLERFDVVILGPVRGLAEGAEVRFNGLPVGKISEIGLDPINPFNVIARIAVKEDTPIRIDSFAVVETLQPSGEQIITLTPGSSPRPRLIDYTRDHSNDPKKVPIIRSQRSAEIDPDEALAAFTELLRERSSPPATKKNSTPP